MRFSFNEHLFEKRHHLTDIYSNAVAAAAVASIEGTRSKRMKRRVMLIRIKRKMNKNKRSRHMKKWQIIIQPNHVFMTHPQATPIK